jgi:hypothetical protein
MNEDLDNIQYSPICDYNYAYWFQKVQPNGDSLTPDERKAFVANIDDHVANSEIGLQMMSSRLKEIENIQGESYDIERTIYSVFLFTILTMSDCMVATKYFMLADTDYDRRYMRGKLKIILNEGFKRLYGYEEKTKNKSEWFRFQPLMKHFPEFINLQYQKVTYLLEKHSKSSSWWKEERDIETHLEAETLYESRQVGLNESKVMMETTDLLGALQAVNDFMTNVNACFLNYFIDKYRRGELSE